MTTSLQAPVVPWPPMSGTSFPQRRLDRMRATLERHVDAREIPGLVALVSRGTRVHVETIGTLSWEDGRPMRRDAIFRLASTTKPLTAAGAMSLVEECRLRLDDPVEEWLPELAERRVLRSLDGSLDDTVPARRSITVRDLLTFRSGYGEVFFAAPECPLQRALAAARLPLSQWPFAGTADELMERLGRLPLASQPGERWLYHMSAEILGVLVARVTGRPLGAFLRERLFEPLGMTDTGFVVPEADLDRLPACYGRDPATGRLIVLDGAHGGYSRPRFESGAGGLVSTVDDLLAFGRMMLRAPGCAHVLSRPTIELMTADHLTPAQKAVSPFFEGFWDRHGWGLGLGVVTGIGDVGDRPGRFGWDGAFGTSWWVDPQEDMVGILMTQRRPDRLALPAVVRDFWTSVYQLIEE